MNPDLALLDSPLLHAMARALLHSLWQGAVIAAVLYAALHALERGAARVRYAVACLALLGILAAPIATAVASYEPVAPEHRLVRPVAAHASQPGAVRENPAAAVDAAAMFSFSPERYFGLVVVAWMIGVVASALRLAADSWRLRTLLRTAEPAPEPWQQRLDRLTRRAGMIRMVTLLQSARIQVPCAARFLRPVVLVPVSAFTALSTRDLELILAHEIAHIRRHDFLVNILQRVVETLLFFNPAARWVSRVIRDEREHCCDDAAVLVTGSKVAYARALTELAALQLQPCAAGVEVSSAGGSLVERIGRLVVPDSPRRAPRMLAGVSALLLVSTLAVAAPYSVARREPPVGLAQVSPADIIGPTLTVEPSPPPAAPEPTPSPEPSVRAGTSPRAAPAPAPVAQKTKDEKSRKNDKVKEKSKAESGRSGTTELSVDDLVALKTADVTPEYIRSLETAGVEADVETLVSMGHAGVTADYVQRMRATFGPKLTSEDIVRLAHMGIDTSFVETLRSVGFQDLDPTEVTNAAAVGVSAEYVKQMRAAGVPASSLESVAHMRAVGVDPAFVKELASAGYSVTSAKDLASLAAVGVNAHYIRELANAGYKPDSIDDLQQLRALGVSAKYVGELAGIGFADLTIGDVSQLAALGVTADYVRDLREAGLKNLTADDVVRLKASGIDKTFLRDIEGRTKKRRE